jgi:hypothetical protein
MLVLRRFLAEWKEQGQQNKNNHIKFLNSKKLVILFEYNAFPSAKTIFVVVRVAPFFKPFFNTKLLTEL